MLRRKLRPTQTLQLVRRVARRHGLRVVDVPDRGKGSHQRYALVDEKETQVGHFTVPQHARELSWTVLRSIESSLAPLFGAKWMEED